MAMHPLSTNPNVVPRQLIERKIAIAIIDAAVEAGYGMKLYNGGPDYEIRTKDRTEMLEAMFATDEEEIVFYQGNQKVGWVQLVYGNYGWDVISDYTVNIEAFLKPAIKLAESLKPK